MTEFVSAATRALRVLVVDDDPAIRRSVNAVLRRHFAVETCASAEEALVLLRATDFEVVCSDYDMPGKNGVELFQAVKERGYPTGFLLLTGGSHAFESEPSGNYYVLLKPYEPEQLVRLISEIGSVIAIQRRLAGAPPALK